ncbi:Cupin domain-containing protein [Prauserella shujinwangii]|uniref:Cupin domain-containing protein n=1 Tax=Prauserella shujinwangii TaxID=1453103 RepID=A0A2T0LKV7_9PSEU|nr:cupin domain-containing protein [Prauserella shujinwangii]PRX43576.1 Cupin domain-containing protein [Prauserella shujinwangii]
MTLATLACAPRFENAGFVFRPLAVPSRGSAELAVWALEAPPGAESERHTVSREEVLVLHEGRMAVEVGDDRHELTPGDAVIVPPDTPVRLRNPADRPARLTVCTSRGMRGTVHGRTIDPPWAR